MWGSGCCTVGRAFAYNVRGPGFDSTNQQFLWRKLTYCRKDKNIEKEARNAPFLRKIMHPN